MAAGFSIFFLFALSWLEIYENLINIIPCRYKFFIPQKCFSFELKFSVYSNLLGIK